MKFSLELSRRTPKQKGNHPRKLACYKMELVRGYFIEKTRFSKRLKLNKSFVRKNIPKKFKKIF